MLSLFYVIHIYIYLVLKWQMFILNMAKVLNIKFRLCANTFFILLATCCSYLLFARDSQSGDGGWP